MLKLFRKKDPPIEHRTTDGGKLCPHPGMTDADLHDYEDCFNVPTSFPQKGESR